MIYDLDILTEPAGLPVDLDDVKLHLKEDLDDNDLLIASLIRAARDYVEMYTRRVLVQTEYRMTFDYFPLCDQFHLVRSPLVSVVQVQYYDTDGTQQVLASSKYIVSSGKSSPGRIALAPNEVWPDTEQGRIEAVSVDFTCGYTTIKDTFKAAIKLLVAHWYENREAVVIGAKPEQVPMTVNMILDGERIYEAPN